MLGDSSDLEGKAEIGLAKWTKKREPVSCPFTKKEKEKFGFDVTKADRIFDLLLQEGQIKSMKIDRHPFPTNMVELKENDADEGVKILTSDRAKSLGVVDPKAQASANRLGGNADIIKDDILEDLIDALRHRC